MKSNTFTAQCKEAIQPDPEIWKPIKDWPDYRISTRGRVISLKGNIPRILKQAIGNHGYPVVVLYNKGTKQMKLVHRLVAAAFIPNPENKPEINHIDGNKTNNNVSNLEWIASSENNKHAIQEGLCIPFKAKITAKHATEIFLKAHAGTQSLSSLSKEYGIAVCTIRHIKNGRTWAKITTPYARAQRARKEYLNEKPLDFFKVTDAPEEAI